MNEAKPQRSKIVRDYLTSHPDAQSLTLAKGLYKKYPQWFASVEAARNSVRYYRGNHGDQSRKDMARKDMIRPNGKAGELPPCPPNRVDDWDPYLIDGPKRLLILSDIHVPYHNPKALDVAIKFAKDNFGPDCVLLNGDIGDYYTVSHWERNPYNRQLKEEIEDVGNWLDWLRSHFPKQRIIYKEGNHDERLDKYIWQKAPELWGIEQCRLPELLKLSKRKIDHVADQRRLFFGHVNNEGDKGLLIFHGHELPKGLASPVNMARGIFIRTIHTTLCGHGHKVSHHPEPNALGKIISCWSTGCLCDMNPRFARVNKWIMGFATVELKQPGSWKVSNYTIDKDTYEVW